MEIKKIKVLVTGGAGFIGSHLCERLLKEGAEVVILDDFSTGKLSNLEGIKKNIEIIKGKVENYNDVLKAIKGCSIVIHQAFPYGESSMGLENQYVKEGVMGTFNVLKASVKNKVKKLVNASSVAVYGIPNYLPVDEKHPINPFLPYGATKYAGELYCKTFSRLYGLDTVSLRYFYVYGPRYAKFDHSAMVNFMNRAIEKKTLLIYGDGSQVRDYTYIDDIIDGTLLATSKENTAGAVYNISYGEGIKIFDLAKKISKTAGGNTEVRFAKTGEYKYSDEYCVMPIGMTTKKGGEWIDERNYVGNISKARKELNYNPKFEIELGIKKTIDWMESLKN